MVLKGQRLPGRLRGACLVRPPCWGEDIMMVEETIHTDHKRHLEVAESRDFSCIFTTEHILFLNIQQLDFLYEL